MNIFTILGIASGIASVLEYPPYIRDICTGTTKPQRASWGIWTLLGSIAFASQMQKGATDSLWMTGVQTIGTWIIFLLSVKHGEGGVNRRDIVSILFAVFGVTLWFFTREATYALCITICVDLVGSIMTLRKAYEEPESETTLTYVLAGISGLLAAFSVGQADWVRLVYPLYICVINFAVVAAAYIGKRKTVTAVPARVSALPQAGQKHTVR